MKLVNALKEKYSLKKHKSLLKIVLVLVGAFALYGSITAISAYRTTLTNNYEIVRRQAEVTSDSINRNMSMIRGTMIALSGSDSIVKWRSDNDYFNASEKERLMRIENLTQDMQNALIYNNGWNMDLFDYVAIYEEDELLTFTYTKQQSIQRIKEKSKEICDRVIDTGDYYTMYPPTEADKSIYTTLRVQSDFKSGKSLYIIGCTSLQVFEEELKKMTGYQGACLYLLDGEANIFASNKEHILDIKSLVDLDNYQDGVRRSIKAEGVKYSITINKISQDYFLVYMLPIREIMHQTIINLRSLFALMIIMTLVMASVVTVIESGYESRILKEESELKFLQSQMNPHFLFNILLTIQIKAKMSGDEDVSRMITSLSNLLRAGIYGDKRSKIKISEELKYVEYYLSLQKERFDERLTYEIKVYDDALLDCEVPRLSIEPLVENAVVHGLEEVERNGFAKICVSAEGNDICIHVIDNGKGFDPLFDINKPEEDIVKGSKREKVGLRNTNKRIKLMYGNQYGITIESKPLTGTDVMVRIPRAKWRSYD